MSSVNIPEIAISFEPNEDQDSVTNDIAEALTDTEVFFREEVPAKKSKLKIKILETDGGTTDVEDVEASDDEDHQNLTKHFQPISVQDLEQESYSFEEMIKTDPNNGRRGSKQTQSHGYKDGTLGVAEIEDGLTDVEDFGTDDEEPDMAVMPEINLDFQDYRSDFVTISSNFKQSTDNEQISTIPSSGKFNLDDVETVLPIDSTAKKSKLRRRRSRGCNRKHVKKSLSLPINHKQILDSDCEEKLRFPLCKQVVTSPADGVTDTEDFEDLKSPLQLRPRVGSVQMEKMEDIEIGVEEKQQFKLKALKSPVDPKILEDFFTKLNMKSDTEDESIEGELEERNFPDIELPPPTRMVVLLHENQSLVPTTKILPLDDNYLKGLGVQDEGGVTDVENIPDDFLGTGEDYSRAPTPEVRGYEFSSVVYEDNRNNLAVSTSVEPVTDTEEMVFSENRKRHKNRANVRREEKGTYLAPIFSADPVTDTEDFSLIVENPTGKVLTDVEDVDLTDSAKEENLTDVDDFQTDNEHFEDARPTSDSHQENLTTSNSPVLAGTEEVVAFTEDENYHDAGSDQTINVNTDGSPSDVMYLKGGAYFPSVADVVDIFEDNNQIGVFFNVKAGSIGFGPYKEWDVAKKSSPPEETPGDAQDAEQGLSTTTELIDGNEPVGQPLTGFSHLVIDQTLLDQTNAFIQSESQPEPYDISIDTKNDMSDKKADDNKHNINEKKKAKKGFFGSIKTFVKESFESDSDSEKSPKKAKKDKKKKRGKEESLPPKKPKLPTPPLEPSDLDAIPFVEDMPPPYRPPEVPVTDLDEPPVEEAPTAPHAVKEETSPPSKPKEEKLRKSKSREKSPKRPPKVTKTIVVEEVTKTIEPLVVETEEFSIVVDPTRKESPKKSKETFTINIDESIEKIEKEIMEKSPILPEEKILKPIVDLDAPIRPPRLKDHVYEDIQEPELSPPPDHIINVSNITEDLIKSEIHFAGWSDDPHNVSNKTEVVEKLKKVDEIIEKHDKEVLKEKELEGSPKPKQKDEKGGFFGLFKKSKKDDETKFPEKVKSPEKTKNEVDTIKSSEEIPKTDAQLLFSDIVVQEMADSTKFLQGEVDSYHDVRPKVQAFAEEVIEVELPESSAEPGGFFNLFKKSKKDEEKSPKKTVTEVKPPIEMKAEEKPLLSESALDDMARTGTFVTDKGIVAEIKPQDLEVVTTEVIAIRDDEEKPVKIKSRESSEERGGFFGFFKKSKKDEETAAIKSPEKSSSPDAKKKIEEPKSAAKDMADTNKFLIDEVQNYHDVKPELTQPREETLIIEKVSETVEGKIGKPIKVKSRESSEERSGFFGLFKKSKHDEEMSPEKKAGEAKATLSDVVITNMANTRQFLNDEVENYHDVRPQPVQLWAEKQFSDELVEIKVTEKPKIKSRESSEDRGGPFGLFKKSKKENDIEFGPPEEKSLLEQTVIEDKTDTRKFLIEDQRIWDENIDIDETIKGEGKAHKSKSRESSLERGLLGFFKKSKKDEDSKSPEKKKKKEETSTSVIKAMVDTDKFLEDGVKHYDDVKPAEQVATETEKVVSKTEDLLESSAPKMTSRESSLERGMVGFFKPRTSEDLKFREKKRRFDDKSLYSESMAKERAAIEAIMRSDEYHLDSHAEIVEKYDELMKAEARLEQAQGRGKSRESSQERSLFGFFKKSKKDSKSPEQIKRIHRKRAMDEPLSSESEDEHRDDHDTKLNLTKLNKEDLVKSEEAVVETKVTVLKMKSPESSEEPSGFFGLFKKSRKDEDPAKFTERKIKGKPPFLSDSVVNDIINTTSFLEMEVKHYHDAKPEIRKPHEEKLIVESDIGEVVEEKSKTKSRESSLERGLLGFFKKSKKDEDSKPEKKKKIKNKSLSFAESVVKDGTSPDTFVKEVETSHSTKHKVPKQSEEVGKVNERLVKHETILDETAAKVKSRESSQERGLFGFFKKAKKESKSPEPIKRIHRKRSMSFPSDSEDETRDDHDTKLDLTKPNKEDLVKSEEIVTKAEEKVQSPEKKIEEKLAISDSVAMDKSNTSKFLEDEVQHYHDAKPKVTKPLEDILIIETDNVDIQPELADQIPKDISGEPSEDRSGFFGLFKKSKKDEDQKLPESRKTEATSTFSDSVIKDMDDTGKFLSDEVQRYHDVKTETSALSVAEEQLAEIKPERGTETEVSSKVKSQGSSEERGFFGLLKKPSKDEEKLSAKRLDEVKLTATESVVNELEDTNRFLIDEVKNYHDVKTELCVKSEENAGAESKVLGTPLHEGKAPKIKSRESSQERGFLGLFKKSKKDEEASPEKKKKLAISDSVLKDMTDTGMFLDGEVQNYHDVRPEPNVIASEDIVDIKTEVAASQEQPFIIKSSESSEERTGFLGLFKKSKKDEGQSQEKKKKGDIKPVILQDVVDSKRFLEDEVQNYHDVKSESIALIEEPAIITAEVLDTKSAPSVEEKPPKIKSRESSEERGFLGLFKKSKKDEEKSPEKKKKTETKPAVSEEAVKDMADTSKFLQDEVKNYHDAKPEPTSVIKEEKLTESEVTLEDRSFKIASRESSEERSGFFGFFKKSKKEEESRLPDRKHIVLSDSVLKNMADTSQFLNDEVQNYHDAKPEHTINETEWEKIEVIEAQVEGKSPKVKSRESSEERTGFLGFFKKSRKDHEEVHEKPSISEAVIKDMADTQQFLGKEVQHYHDVKLQGTEATAEMISTKAVESHEESKTKESPKKVKSRESSEERGGLFGLFKKSKKDEEKTAVPQIALKDADETAQGFGEEAENYESVVTKPIKAVEETVVVGTEITDTKAGAKVKLSKAKSRESSEERGSFLGFFKKSKKDEEVIGEPSEAIIKEMADTKNFLSCEVQHYHDEKPVIAEETAERAEGQATKLTEVETKPEIRDDDSAKSIEGPLKKSDDSAIKDMADTAQFLSGEVQHYHDVKTMSDEIKKKAAADEEVGKVLPTEEEGVVKEPSKSGLFGLFKKSKKDEGGSPEKTRKSESEERTSSAVKVITDTNQFLTDEVQNYHDVMPEGQTIVTTETVVKTQEISEPTALVGILKKTRKEDRITELASPSEVIKEISEIKDLEVMLSHEDDKPGLFGLFKKSKKDEEKTAEILEKSDDKPAISETGGLSKALVEPVVTEVFKESTEAEPQKKGFLSKFKKVKRKPSLGTQLSQEVLKDMADTNTFLKTEVENYEDEKLVGDLKLLEQLAPVANDVEEKSVTFDDVVEVASDLPLEALEVDDVVKIDDSQDSKLGKKDKKGFFNIFGKKSKSQDASIEEGIGRPRDDEGSSKKPKEKRRKSSPFKFFDKKKSEEDFRAKSEREDTGAFIKTELENYEDSAGIAGNQEQDEVWIVESENITMDLTQEVLDNLERKIDEMNSGYSKEIMQDIQNCNDFLYLEMYNYDDGKPEVVTDLDKGIMELSWTETVNGLSGRAVDDIVDAAIKTAQDDECVVLIQMEETIEVTEENLDKQEDKTKKEALAKVEETSSLVKTKPESIKEEPKKKEEEPKKKEKKPRKHSGGFLSKLGGVFSGASKDVEEKTEKLSAKTKELEKSMGKTVEEISKKPQEISSRLEETVGEAVDVTSKKAEGFKQVAGATVDKTKDNLSRTTEATGEKLVEAKTKLKGAEGEIMDATDDATNKVSATLYDVKDATKKKAETVKEIVTASAQAGTEKFVHGLDNLAQATVSRAEDVKETSKGMVEKLGQKKDVITEASGKSALKISRGISDLKEAAGAEISYVEEGVKTFGEEILDDANKAKKAAKDQFSEVRDDTEALGEKIIDDLQKKKETAKQTTGQLAEEVEGLRAGLGIKVTEVKEDISKKKKSVKETTKDVLDATKAKFEEAKFISKTIGTEIRDDIVSKRETAKETTVKFSDQVGDSVDALKGTTRSKVDEISESAGTLTKTYVDKVHKKEDDLKEVTKEIANATKEKVDECKDKTKLLAADVSQELTKKKDVAKEVASTVSSQVIQKLEDLQDDTEGKMQKVCGDAQTFKKTVADDLSKGRHDVKDFAEDTAGKVADEISEHMKMADVKIDHAKSTTQAFADEVFQDIARKTEKAVESVDHVKSAGAKMDQMKRDTEALTAAISEDFSNKKQSATAATKEVIADVGKTVQDKVGEAQAATEAAAKLAAAKKEEANKALLESEEMAASEFESFADETKETISKGLFSFGQSVGGKFDEVKTAAASKVEDISKVKEDTKQEVVKMTSKGVSDCKQAADESQDQVLKKKEEVTGLVTKEFGDLSHTLESGVVGVKEKTREVVEDLGKIKQEIVASAAEEVDDIKGCTKEKMDQAADEAIEEICSRIHEVEKSTIDLKERVDEVSGIAADTSRNISDDLHKKVKATGDKVEGMEEQTRRIVQDVGATVVEASADIVTTASEGAKSFKGAGEEKISDTKASKKVMFEEVFEDLSKKSEGTKDALAQKIKEVETSKVEGVGQIEEAITKKKDVVERNGKFVAENLHKVKQGIGAVKETVGTEVDSLLPKFRGDDTQSESDDSVPYVTSPTMARRAVSQRYSSEERPAVREVSSVKRDDGSDDECYIVTEPEEEHEDTKRKPMFRLESEDDDSLEGLRPVERSDSVKSNVLETLTETKLENLLSNLVQDLADSGSDVKEKTSGKVAEVEVELEQIKKDSEADVDEIEKKLRDLDKALDSLEQATDPKMEKKLHRVERKFERMASDVLEKDVEEVSPTEVATRRENEFQKLVSQLSTEEVSDFQKEYSHLWDETTFSKTDEWDSKTPDSQVEELPQGEVVYMGPVTLNKDNLINKAGIEVNVIPIMKSPCHSPKPKKKSQRAKSALDFYEGGSLKEFDRGSLPDLKKSPWKGSLVNTILELNPDRFLYGSTTSLRSCASYDQSLSRGEIMDAVLDWLEKSEVDSVSSDSSKAIPTITVTKEKKRSRKRPLETTCPPIIQEVKQPQPKPRKASQPKLEKQISPVRDDLLDDEELVPETYSDKKKFWESVATTKGITHTETPENVMKKAVPVPKPRLSQESDKVPEEKIMTEYQASFQAPSERTKPDSSGSDSDNGQQEGTGYISDSGDVEQYISDSEIEDRVPQIRERQMSVFSPPVAGPRKAIYERSASLPTEDMYEVSARSIKLRKQYYEEQIRKEMIEEQLTSEIEEEPSPERKTLASCLSEDIEDSLGPVEHLGRMAEKEESVHDIVDFMEVTQTHKIEEQALISNQTKETHKEIELDSQTKRSSVTSESSSEVDKTANFSKTSKPDSMEVHVDKSELEDSEKLAELDQDATDLETKSLDSFNTEISPKSSVFVDDHVPEITVSLSGVQRRISEESDEYAPKSEPKSPEESQIEAAPEITVTLSGIQKRISEESDEYAPKSPDEVSPHISEEIPEVTVTLSGIQKRISEESDEYAPKSPEEISLSKVPEETPDITVTLSGIQKRISEESDEYAPKSPEEISLPKVPEETPDITVTLSGIQKRISEESDEYAPKSPEAQVREILVKTPEEAPDITVTLSGIQKRISEESDEYAPKEVKSPINVPEEHQDNTVWEVSVQSQDFEKATDIDQVAEKLEDDFSIGTRDESDLGSEIHQDHSDSLSDKIKSESQSDIERIILDSLHQQKVDPEEAKAIASALIEEIETEIHKRECLPATSPAADVSDYLKYLAETKGLDEREVELVESVLARRQRELAKLSRGDTQASSIEITDEDLKYSGGEIDSTHLLEQQISQLKAERVDDKSMYASIRADKIDEERREELHWEKDEATSDSTVKTDLHTKTFDSVKETKDVIFEEDETISESASQEVRKIEAVATESTTKILGDSVIEEARKSLIDVTKTVGKEAVEKIAQFETDDSIVKKSEDFVKRTDEVESKISYQIDVAERKPSEDVLIKGEITCDDSLKKEEFSTKKQTSEVKTLEEGTFAREEEIKETHSKITQSAKTETQIEEQRGETVESKKSSRTRVTSVDVTHETTKSKEVTEKIVELDASMLPIEMGEIKIERHEEIKRTSSSESSMESGKSPDDQFSTCSSGRKGDSDTPKDKPEVVLRKGGLSKPDRKSGLDFETYSSSGESHYHSFELDSGKSRPCSSDIEGLVPGSSEYESALTSQEHSTRSHVTSTEYQTAVSSLSSKESMKSLDSESSGHLGSIEVSEVSETLVPSSSDAEGDILDTGDQLIDEVGWNDDPIEKESTDKLSKMKRSYEMTFQPEPRILAPESPQTDDTDRKFTSMDDGSVVSMSLSSTSSTTGARTVIELSRADSERGAMTISGTSDQLSIEGSCDSLVFHPTPVTSDVATSTTQSEGNFQIESITITTSTVNESGIRSVSTQVISESHTPEDERVKKVEEINGKCHTEMKKKGHRRQESTSFIPSLLDQKSHSELTESDKYTAELSFKEVSSDEKKDIDESYETEADQGFHRDVREGKYSEEEIKDDTPEFSSEAQASVGELEQEYSSALAREARKKPDLSIQKDHGRSSSTSSEKSSFEEAEAEAAFNMVAHVSPAHKIKQICPILEDEDAEKHELETRERAQKEFEKRRAQVRDHSPGFIPDIKVTQHMTPLVDKNFHYPDLELEAKEREKESETQTPQTPASSKSSEDTDQGREYVLEDSGISIPEEASRSSTVIEQTIKEEGDKDTESPGSDSFEMLEKPDLIDDFVVIEEVAKEAQEFDSEGKSVSIQAKPGRRSKKHDEEVEAYLTKSAPTPLTKMTDVKYYPDGSSSEELGFDFEDSPPQPAQQASTYDRELEANRKWIEQQFQGDQAARMAAGYDYEMEFERGPLEDIKEEDINDFDPTSSRIGSLGSQKESGGSLGSIKDSYSSTPEYDVLAGRKYFTRSGEHDDVSMSSLQEFENLERAMSLETRRCHQGSQDSSSNGSFKTRYYASKSGQGDDVSVSSLKEFEGLEMACIAAHTIETKANEEEAMLAQIDEGQESLASESESCETISSKDKKVIADSDEEDYEKRMFEIDEIIKQAQTNVERFIDLKEADKTESLGRGDSIEEVSKVPDLDLDAPLGKASTKVQWKDGDDPMIISTDSIDVKGDKGSHHDSTDSLDQKTGADIMTASTDSIEFQLKKNTETNLMSDSIEIKDEACGMVCSDSLELPKGSTVDMLESTDSLDPTSSAATHATYQYESDSVFSGSFTSGGSNTMVSSTDTIDPVQVDIAAAARKVWFDQDPAGFTSEYLPETGKPYVTEIIEPIDDDGFSHTVHRRVELPPEVRKVTFYGSDADEKLKQFIDDFNEGEQIEEFEEVDAAGNVHTKRIVQKRVIIRGDGTELLTNRLTKEATGEEAGSTFSAPHEPAPPLKATHRRQLRYEISIDDQIEVDPREHDWRFNLPEHAEGEESAFGTQRSSDQQRSVSDQHQLSEEMKQLLKELEKESKQ